MDVCICLDSEDYLTPQAADAELWFAQELTARGIKGGYQFVGEMIRTLQRTGRQDVIDALAKHDFGFHTDWHSAPPNHAEAVNDMDLVQAVEFVRQREAPCLETLQKTFGQTPISYVSPGASWTPATLLVMAEMGVKIWASHRFPLPDNQPFWYCGLLALRYAIFFDDYFTPERDRTDEFLPAFDKVAAQTADDGVVVIATHPCRLVNAQWADRIFFGGQNPPRNTWGPAPQWPASKQQRIKDQLRYWLDDLQRRPDVRFTDLSSVYQKHKHTARDLTHLLAEENLSAGQADRLPLKPQVQGHIPQEIIGQTPYKWNVFAPEFTGSKLVEQAQALAWTTAPA